MPRSRPPDRIVSPERVLCDLRWLLKHPPIEADGFWQRVQKAWSGPPPVDVPGIETPAFVGPYFERLCYQLISGLHPHRLIQGLRFRDPAVDAGRGESELDFLLQLDDGWHHVEVAAKFYLGVETSHGVEWVGPNQRDRLAKKRKHLRERQSQRLNNPVARERVANELRQRDVDPEGLEEVRAHSLMHGILFRPHDRALLQPTPCAAPLGRWLSASRLTAYIGDEGYQVCDKPQWFAGPREGHSALRDGPTMIAQGASNEPTDRLFVVPDDWEARLR